MDKKTLYWELKRRNIPVNWIGSTRQYLSDLLDQANEPSVFVDTIFNVYDNIDGDFLFSYSRTFSNISKLKINETIDKYIFDKNNEYGDTYIKEKDKKGRVIRDYDPNTPENYVLNVPLQRKKYNITSYVKNEEWNHNDNECVVDYIVDRLYNKNSIAKDIVRKSLGYVKLDSEIGEYYDANNVIELAEKLHVNIYITHFNKLIFKKINNEGHKKKKCLCFEIRNNHVYPINDKQIISKIMNINNKKKEKKKEKDKIINKKLCFHSNEDSIGFIFDKIKETEYLPYNSIMMKHGKIQNFILDDTYYVSHPKDEKMEKYCEKNNIQYTGQSIQKYVKPYLKEIPSSFMNYQILSALTAPSVKHRVHLGNPYKLESKPDDKNIDINKCYRSCIQEPYDQFMTVDFHTVIKKQAFNNEYGLWYVETKDMTLLHKNNWYSNKILERAKQDGIKFKATHFIQGIKTNFSFIDIINKLEREFENDAKIAINSIVGFLGQTNEESTFLRATTDFNDVLPIFKKNNPVLLEKDDVFLFGNSTEYKKHLNFLPMWIQILDWSNIRLHNLIMDHGTYSNLVYRRTDLAVMRNCKVEVSNKIGKYKLENKKINQLEYYDNRNAPLIIANKEYNKIDNLLEHLEKKKSLLINGRAGTGKSWYINKFAENHNCIKLAFTNKAANNINGQTLHKFFKLDENNTTNVRRDIKADAIIIDEISMIPEFLWQMIISLKNQCNVPIVLVGDYRQLPPVEKKKSSNIFDNPSIAWLTDYNNIELTERQRYDEALWNYLENPYQLDKSNFNFNAMHICYTNECVNRINRIMNDYHVKDPITIIDNMRLNKNIRLLCQLTTQNLIKNETYIIEDIVANDNKNISLKIKNVDNIIELSNENFIKLFKLSYAMTTHKLQGSTIDGPVQIHEIDINSDKRLFYTAYSRATKLSNISFN